MLCMGMSSLLWKRDRAHILVSFFLSSPCFFHQYSTVSPYSQGCRLADNFSLIGFCQHIHENSFDVSLWCVFGKRDDDLYSFMFLFGLAEYDSFVCQPYFLAYSLLFLPIKCMYIQTHKKRLTAWSRT